MKLRYSLTLAIGLGSAAMAFAQPPCLTSFTTPAGQVNRISGWNPATVPPTTQVNLAMTTNGTTAATVTGCNAALVGATVSGPNVLPGTTITATACTGVTLSQAASGSGTSVVHTFTMGPYASSAPPTNTGLPAGVNCSVCPAVFSINACAGDYFTYQMCVGNIYTVSMCGAATNWDSYLAITTTGGTVLATGTPTSDDDGCGTVGGHATLSFVPTATGSYRVRLWLDPCTVSPANCGTLQVACNPVPAPPANDEPQNAVSLGNAPTTCSFISGTDAWATQSATTPTGCTTGGCGSASGSFGGYDVWYSINLVNSGNLSAILQTVSAGPTAFAIYTGIPGALTQVSNSCVCSNFVSVSGLAFPSTVYIRVWPQTGLVNTGSFQLCAYEPIPPPNDNPCGATGLTVGTSCGLTPFSTQNATGLAANITTAPASPSCGLPVAGGDVWFSAVMPATGSMTFNTQAGTLTDLAMAVYTLTAGSIATPCPTAVTGTLTEAGCNDNFGANPMPSVTVGGTPGTTYYIRLWNKTTAFGTASICAVQNLPPPNNDPCGAIALTVNTGCVFPAPYSTQFATITAGAPNPSCNAGPYNSDVWFTAVIPPSGQLILDTDDGGLTDGGMAVYTGTCSALTQVAAGNGGCVVAGSANGGNMPMTTITGVAPGTTVYIRIWRQSGNDGTFLLCARNPANPAGCYYTLRMADSAGDGWNGGFVTLCVDPAGAPPPVCTNYTVTGATAFITFGAALGDAVSISYTPVGGFQNQISYNLQASNGFNMFASNNPPASGFNFAFTVNSTCNVPAAPISDCIGAFQVCNNQSINIAPGNFGNTQDLNISNRGCLLTNERQGAWFTFTTNTVGTIAFNINVGVGTDYDFGVWGPYSGPPPCPPVGPPMRCNWSAVTGPTGLNYTAINTTEPAGGPPFSRWIDVVANQTYLLYIDNYTMNGLAFTLAWNNVPNTILDCVLPVEFMDFEAFPKARQVDLKWTTASENNSAYFNVERSQDGGHYELLGTVAAMGHSQSVTEYDFVDDAPMKGVNYYRLDQVDADGQREYSKVVTAVYRWGNLPLTVYPNPAGESLWANFDLPAAGNIRWRIIDASGRVVHEKQVMVVSGVNQLEVPLIIDAGSYLIELIDDQGVLLGNARFVRQ